MNQGIAITKDIRWIGVNDRDTQLFENLWPLPYGVSYNAYMIQDQKTALIDTVKVNTMKRYMERIRSFTGQGIKIDYLIINHMEPDHSGAIEFLVEMFPEMVIIGNEKTSQFLDGFYEITKNIQIVKDGEELCLGKHTLQFFMTPMVHWPETMMTYDKTDKVIFSGDAFGGFGTLDGGIFDDELKIEYYEDEARRYYSNIVGKYSPMVQKALSKLAGLDIQVVASTHGPVWRKNPKEIIRQYDRWSRYEADPGVIIVYGSMYGNTAKMADILARRLAEEGIKEVMVYNSSVTHPSFIINNIWKYKGVILGSCAYNTGLFPPMQTLVSMLESRKLGNRVLGLFGTYAWSGGGVSNLCKYSETCGWPVLEPIVEARCSPKQEDDQRLNELAKQMAKAVLQS